MDPLSNLFFWLSKSRRTERFIMGLPFARRFSRRFVAGESIGEVIPAVIRLREKGLLTTVDHLGESIAEEKEAKEAAGEYLILLDEMKKHSMDSQVSLKLTQMGMDIDEKLCVRNVAAIVRRAKNYPTFVCIDMESSLYTTRTLNLYKLLRERFRNVGVVIQANLLRSRKDIGELIELGVNVRLCKGAYKETPDIVYTKKSDVDKNFIELMKMLFSSDALKKGVYPAIATHDENMIDWVKEYTESNRISRDKFEFQMLYGIRSKLQEKLAKEGYRMRVYVPYGTHWYPYFMRRLAERPANVLFLTKNLFRK